ncbi:Hypothetical predicted protein, partial [Pelobates cultripes]
QDLTQRSSDISRIQQHSLSALGTDGSSQKGDPQLTTGSWRRNHPSSSPQDNLGTYPVQDR